MTRYNDCYAGAMTRYNDCYAGAMTRYNDCVGRQAIVTGAMTG
jgi:hypothetical protein